jgi:hypothetical protein
MPTMPRRLRVLLISLCALAGLLAAAPAGQAAKRVAPAKFFGVQYGEDSLTRLPVAAQDQQTAAMAQSGVESVRVVFRWRVMEPTTPGAIDFSATDAIVASAVTHGIDVLPIVVDAPRWASTKPNARDYGNWPPTDKPRPYTDFLRALIARYGPKGSFWTANPALAKRPIRAWEVWNEPGFRYFFGPKDYRKSYPKLLRASYTAIKRADRGAKVVMAGLANGQRNSWDDLDRFYAAGVKGHYDVLALHPYAVNTTNARRIITEVRKVLRKRGDMRKPIWLTELTWPASKGKIPADKNLGLEVTTAQQSRYLSAAYRLYARSKAYNVKRVYWFTWASTYQPRSVLGSAISFEYSGLNAAGPGGITPLPILTTYQRVARELQGCVKTAAGVCA